MKKIVRILILLIMSLFIFNPDITQTAYAKEKTPAPLKDWTILTFLNADNDLDEYGVKDVNEMEKIGSNDRVNIITLLDRQYGTAQKLYITKDNDDTQINSTVLEEMGDYDMGNYLNLVKFVTWGIENYPAKHYMVVIWNHGTGWWKNPAGEIKGISYDDQSNHHISPAQLGEAMAMIYQKNGKKLDILAMDACLMQMAEVCYEFKDYVQYCVASEDSEPSDGYAYDEFLGALVREPAMTPETLAKTIALTFAIYYENIGKLSTQSIINFSRFDEFIEKFDKLCIRLIELLPDNNVLAAISNKIRPACQTFYLRTNIDLGYFLKLILDNIQDEKAQQLASESLALYSEGTNPLIAGNYMTGNSIKNATGLAIYFHSFIKPDNNYNNLNFSKNTSWAMFLDSYIAAANAHDWYEKANKE